MKLKGVAALLGCITAATLLNGELLTAESNTFTFPPITAVSRPAPIAKPTYFKHTAMNTGSRTVTFSWSLPSASRVKSGSITVYTLRGQMVAKLPLSGNVGTVRWQLPSGHCKNGLYVARLTHGANVRNLKLMLWN